MSAEGWETEAWVSSSTFQFSQNWIQDCNNNIVMCCLFPTRNYSTIWDLLAVDSIVTAEEPSQFELTMKQIKEYGDVFIGDGCLEGEYKIESDERVEPVKWVPVVMMTSLRGSNKGSSNESHHHTCGEKARSGSVAWSLCRNLMRSHRYICTHFPLHSIDDILPDLYRAKVFTVWYGNQPSSWDFPAKVDTSAGGAVGHKH